MQVYLGENITCIGRDNSNAMVLPNDPRISSLSCRNSPPGGRLCPGRPQIQEWHPHQRPPRHPAWPWPKATALGSAAVNSSITAVACCCRLEWWSADRSG